MVDGQILRRREVEQLTGLSCASIYRRMKEGSFPRSIELGPRAVGWLTEDVQAWIRDRRSTEPLLDEDEAARFLQEETETLREWRTTGAGPAHYVITREKLVRYDVRDLRRWLEGQGLTEHHKSA